MYTHNMPTIEVYEAPPILFKMFTETLLQLNGYEFSQERVIYYESIINSISDGNVTVHVPVLLLLGHLQDQTASQMT